jgi:hypothetical protein
VRRNACVCVCVCVCIVVSIKMSCSHLLYLSLSHTHTHTHTHTAEGHRIHVQQRAANRRELLNAGHGTGVAVGCGLV